MAEAKLERLRQVFLKKEAASGTPETLTAAEGKMRVAVKPEVSWAGTRNERQVARDSLTNLPGIPGAKASSIKWKCEIAGSGSVATAPAESDALECAGMAKYTIQRVPIGAITGGTFKRGDTCTSSAKSGRLLIDPTFTTGFLYLQVTAGSFANSDVITNGTASATASGAMVAAGYGYSLISAEQPTASVRDEEDGYQKSISGAPVTWKATLEANKQGFWEFEAKGPHVSYGAQTGTAGVTPFTTLPPILQNAQMRVDNYAAVLKSISFDIANTLSLRNDGNAAAGLKAGRIPSRRPNGDIGMEMMDPSDYDLYNKFIDGADAKVQCKLGATAGNTVWFFGDRANFEDIGENSEEGIVVVTPKVNYNGFEGKKDDELEVLFV